MKTLLLSIAMLCCVHNNFAQTTDSVNEKYLNVYLDGAYMFQEYIKTEIPYINYVRDRFGGDVHLLITSQMTGSGGEDYTLFFLGQRSFENKNDTLHYIANTNATSDEIRIGLVHIIKMGLMPYIAKVDASIPITIGFSGESTTEVKQTDDKWKGWVYSISSYGNASLTSVYKSYSISGYLNARKVTEVWKIALSTGTNVNTDIFDLGDGETYIGNNNSLNSNVTIVKSINDHWSVGGEGFHTASTYNNYDNYISVAPAVEYDIFPYKDVNTRLLSIFYKIGPEYQAYTDTTIYNEKEMFLLRQRLDITLSLTQKWGSISTGINASNYFHDISKYGAGIYTSLNWRIIEGLNLNGFFTFNLINDQINLPKGDLTDEEILLQISVQETSFDFFTYFGLSYTFGSIYNNVVNPRFDRGGSFFF